MHAISPVYFGRCTKRITTRAMKKQRGPKPPPPPKRTTDPVEVLKEATDHYKQITQFGKGLIRGLDGIDHMTPEQLHAQFEKDRALLKLKMHDAQARRKDRQAGLAKDPPWYRRGREPMRKFSGEEITAMANKSDAEYVQRRIAKVRALKEGKENRRRQAELRAKRAAVEVWIVHKVR